MDNTWVKLYRKLGDNEIMFDDKGLRVFVWLLIHVDKKTGSLTAGRYQIARELKMNSNTVYKVLSRLSKKHKIVTLTSNNKFTTISLSQWANYNPYSEMVTQDGNIKVTSKQQQSNTKQDIKTIDIKTNTLPDKSGNPIKSSERQDQYRSLINYCREVQGIEKEFVNYVKQTMALKKIFLAGYNESDIRFVIDEMYKDLYWHDNTFDLMNVANGMQKYLNRTVYFKKGGQHASTR